MRKKHGKKRLEIHQKRSAGRIAFTEPKVEKRKLGGKNHGDNYQLMDLSLFNAKGSSGDSGPQENSYGGNAESDAGRGKYPQAFKADFNGHGIGAEEHADKCRKSDSPKRKVFILKYGIGI
jgi:hypothetical protein